jgi:hypothetical protein
VVLALVRPRYSTFAYLSGWVVVGLIVSVGLAVTAGLLARTKATRRLRRWLRRSPRGSAWWLAVATSVVGGVAGVLLALPLRYSYGWDAAVVTRFSRELSVTGTLSAYAHDYLSRYPNNIPLVALMNVTRAIGGSSDADMYHSYILLNGLALGCVLLLTFTLVRMLRGTGAALLAQLVVFVLIGCSPWMAVPYTDIPAMPLVLGAVTLATAAAARERSPLARLALTVLAFASAALAFVIKSTPASTAVAIGIVGVVVLIGASRRDRARGALLLVCGVLAFGVTATAALAGSERLAHVSREHLDTTRTPPLAWWLANGLTTSTSASGRPYFGAYSPEMVAQSTHLGGQQLHQWSENRLDAQVSAMGVGGVVSFEVRKLTFNWGDGMFFAWGAYDFQEARIQRHDATARAIQSWQHISGPSYAVRASLTNGLWLGLLAWSGVGLLRSRYRRDLLVVVMTVVGIASFTLVFQGASRYLLAYVPVIVAVGAGVNPLWPSAASGRWPRWRGRTRP